MTPLCAGRDVELDGEAQDTELGSSVRLWMWEDAGFLGRLEYTDRADTAGFI